VGAKVQWYKDAWWVRVHHGGKRRDKRVGDTAAAKREAEDIARKVNAAIELGGYETLDRSAPSGALPCDATLREWLATYSPTMARTTEKSFAWLIESHLAPHFKARDLRDMREDDLLVFARAKLAEGLATKSIANALGVLRNCCNALIDQRRLDRNPVRRAGRLMRKIARRESTEVERVEYWTEREAALLLRIASETEPRFAPALLVAFSTGCRRGEVLGLQWSGVDFDNRRIAVRRSVTMRGLTTPKSGKAREVVMSDALASALFDLRAERHRECLARGWREIPAWLFPSVSGSTWWDETALSRAWERVRRRAQAEGVRPLRFHATRHSWATWALRAGKSVRWVASQLGHADPAFTLRVYAHAMRSEETDLGFLDEIRAPEPRNPALDGSRRLQPFDDEDAQLPKSLIPLVGRLGLEPRTNGLKARCSTD